MDDLSQTRERILEAAAEVFASEGFAGTRVETVARRAGVNKAALYYHVGDKAALYEATLVRHAKRAADRLTAALEGIVEPVAALETLVGTMADLFAESLLLPRIMIQEVARGGGNLSEPVMREFLRVFACTFRVMEMGRKTGVFADVDPALAHLAIVSCLAMAEMSRPARAKAAAMVPMPGVDWNFGREQAVRHALRAFIGANRP